MSGYKIKECYEEQFAGLCFGDFVMCSFLFGQLGLIRKFMENRKFESSGNEKTWMHENPSRASKTNKNGKNGSIVGNNDAAADSNWSDPSAWDNPDGNTGV